MIALFFLLIVFAMALMGWFPIILAQVYLILSAVTLLMYGLDKLFAINKKQRISEKTLHVVALLGGWPGAYLGQQLFKHKTSKKTFMRTFWFLVFINAVVLAVIFKYYK